MTKLEEIIERAVLNAEGGNPLAACRQACRRAVREALKLAALEAEDASHDKFNDHRVFREGVARRVRALSATLEDKT